MDEAGKHDADLEAFVDRSEGDPHQFRFIVSPKVTLRGIGPQTMTMDQFLRLRQIVQVLMSNSPASAPELGISGPKNSAAIRADGTQR